MKIINVIHNGYGKICRSFKSRGWFDNKENAMLCYAKSLQSCPTLCDTIDSSPPGSHPWDSPGKNTGVGCHFLLQSLAWLTAIVS